MSITLSPEQEQQVRQIAELRGFPSAESYLSELFNETLEQEAFFSESKAEISRLIDEGWASMERGEGLTPEEAKAEREAFKREFLAKRSAA